MCQLKAVIYDVNATLVETERDGHGTAFNLAFLETDLDWVRDGLHYAHLLTVSAGKERIFYYLTNLKTVFYHNDLFADFIGAIYSDKTRYYVALSKNKQLGLRTCVVRLIKEIRANGLRMASSSANVTTLITEMLGKDALGWFDLIATGDSTMAKKPSPAIFNHCLAQFKIPTGQCLAIEDAQKGVKSTIAAHLAALVTFNGALAVFDQLGEVRKPCQDSSGISRLNRYVTFSDLKATHGTR